MTLLWIMAWMMVTEDGTCITTGLLIGQGKLPLLYGIACCYLAIVVGDWLLWLLGRYAGQWMLKHPWMKKRLPEQKVKEYAAWYEQRGWMAILAARFLPGTRTIVYVSAGTLGHNVWKFLLWVAIAAILWTPLLVGGVALFGKRIADPLEAYFDSAWIAILVAAVIIWVAIRLIANLVTEKGRARLIARVSKIWRWEFWPMWLAYLPMLPYVAYLAVRHKGLMTPTATDPGIEPFGGILGESKYEILQKLPEQWVLKARLIRETSLDDRLAAFDAIMSEEGWTFPVIVKPDFGARGASVKLVRDAVAAQSALDVGAPVIVQQYHPGPGEIGVFYYRMPAEQNGRIFSITEKIFPIVVGDGDSTIESLIYQHPRLRMQADTFLARLGSDSQTVLKRGEKRRLVMAGNHCQGTKFLDGERLITPELDRTIDHIAKSFEGFYFGRFDIRFEDENALKRGEGLSIIELNGISSESTNIYDPSWSIFRSYRTLMKQWRIMYEIGAQNRERGVRVARFSDVWAHLRQFRREVVVPALAD